MSSGTFSVVPRVAGGEVTICVIIIFPELTNCADHTGQADCPWTSWKEVQVVLTRLPPYSQTLIDNLYTKITGG